MTGEVHPGQVADLSHSLLGFKNKKKNLLFFKTFTSIKPRHVHFTFKLKFVYRASICINILHYKARSLWTPDTHITSLSEFTPPSVVIRSSSSDYGCGDLPIPLGGIIEQ